MVHPGGELLGAALVGRLRAQRRVGLRLQRLQPLGPGSGQLAVDLPHLEHTAAHLELLLHLLRHHGPAGGKDGAVNWSTVAKLWPAGQGWATAQKGLVRAVDTKSVPVVLNCH